MSLSKIILIFVVLIFSNASIARDLDRDMRRGHGNARGNERSERVDRVETHQPISSGNGCPANTMNVVFAPDNLSFAVLYDQFIAQITNVSVDRRSVMTCNTVVPMVIPAGIQMEITRVDYRGFVGLPDRAQAALSSVFNFRSRMPSRDRMNLRFNFMGPLADDYVVSSDVLSQDKEISNVVVSPCGGAADLQIMNRLYVTTQVAGQQASVTLDSMDAAANATYFVNWRKCEERGGRGPGGGDGRDPGDGRRPPGGRDVPRPGDRPSGDRGYFSDLYR